MPYPDDWDFQLNLFAQILSERTIYSKKRIRSAMDYAKDIGCSFEFIKENFDLILLISVVIYRDLNSITEALWQAFKGKYDLADKFIINLSCLDQSEQNWHSIIQLLEHKFRVYRPLLTDQKGRERAQLANAIDNLDDNVFYAFENFLDSLSRLFQGILNLFRKHHE